MNDNILVADIEGYASIFGERDLNGDIVAPGAFANSLSQSGDVKMLYQHAPETPIGRWTCLKEDRRGLFVAGEILLTSRVARETHALIAGGVLDGLSIGYRTTKARKANGPARAEGRRIIEAELWEVSIVTFPMAEHARITHVGPPRQITQPYSKSAAPAAGRAPDAFPQSAASGARHFADALRSAAQLLSA